MPRYYKINKAIMNAYLPQITSGFICKSGNDMMCKSQSQVGATTKPEKCHVQF